MKAEIVRITAHRACEARTDNQLLVVFACPAAPELRLGDILIFQDLATDGEIFVREARHGSEFAVRAEIHDLRLPSHHGASRTPSRERLRGA